MSRPSIQSSGRGRSTARGPTCHPKVLGQELRAPAPRSYTSRTSSRKAGRWHGCARQRQISSAKALRSVRTGCPVSPRASGMGMPRMPRMSSVRCEW
eukprot:5878140-Prymnesium_polylepis.1